MEIDEAKKRRKARRISIVLIIVCAADLAAHKHVLLSSLAALGAILLLCEIRTQEEKIWFLASFLFTACMLLDFGWLFSRNESILLAGNASGIIAGLIEAIACREKESRKRES